MNRSELVRRLELNDDGAFDEKVNSIPDIEGCARIHDRHSDFR